MLTVNPSTKWTKEERATVRKELFQKALELWHKGEIQLFHLSYVEEIAEWLNSKSSKFLEYCRDRILKNPFNTDQTAH